MQVVAHNFYVCEQTRDNYVAKWALYKRRAYTVSSSTAERL